MYIRFVVAGQIDDDSDHETGLFRVIYALEKAGVLADYELDWFYAAEAWFDKHLHRPSTYSWSSRPNTPGRAISWLKASAQEHVTRMRELAALLEHRDVVVQELQTDRPGYVVYEDEHQVIAVPFSSDTF
jgi:phosphoglycolate phosphatase-like HAD superfamily hydrolase